MYGRERFVLGSNIRNDDFDGPRIRKYFERLVCVISIIPKHIAAEISHFGILHLCHM